METGRIIIVAGHTGFGKTFQALSFGDGTGLRKVLIDVDNKAKDTLDYHREKGNIEDNVDIRPVNKYTTDYAFDYKGTISNMKTIVSDIIKSNAYDVIILDTISHLRNPIVADYYVDINSFKAVGKYGWSDVNRIVWGLVAPLINYCASTGRILIVNCHMKEDFEGEGEDRVSKGIIPDIQKSVVEVANIVIELKKTSVDTYVAECSRSAAGPWSEDISVMKTTYSVLMEKGLI